MFGLLSSALELAGCSGNFPQTSDMEIRTQLLIDSPQFQEYLTQSQLLCINRKLTIEQAKKILGPGYHHPTPSQEDYHLVILVEKDQTLKILVSHEINNNKSEKLFNQVLSEAKKIDIQAIKIKVYSLQNMHQFFGDHAQNKIHGIFLIQDAISQGR